MPKIAGSVLLPGDKSISHRAALFSALRQGESYFRNFNFNQDCQATLNCLNQLGVMYSFDGEILRIHGRKLLSWQKPANALNAENSGTTSRLMSGLLIHLPFQTEITGDVSLSKRPMERIINPLQKMGAKIKSTDGHLPLHFYPAENITGIEYELPVASAQVKSAVLLAGLFAAGQTKVIERVPTRDHTERLLQLKTEFDHQGRKIIYSGRDIEIPDISMTIPGDFSSASFFITAALLLPKSDLVIRNVSLNSTRIGFIEVLKRMGIELKVTVVQNEPEPMGDIHVQHQSFKNISVPASLVPNIIDEIPILSILATQGHGVLEVRNAEELRVKESDRISAVVNNLQAVGVHVTEFADGFRIEGAQRIIGGKVQTFGDHRIAMSFAIANLVAEHEIVLDQPECVNVSFPRFWQLLKQVVQA